MSNAYKVAVLAGDAIGPEIMAQAVRIFGVIEQHRDVAFELIDCPFIVIYFAFRDRQLWLAHQHA